MKVKPMEEIRAVAEHVARKTGVEVVDVTFKGDTLTVYIDTDDGVDLKTCEKYHRIFDKAIDELDPTFGLPYILNVSSPGLRGFTSERDFERALGKEVEVRVRGQVMGVKLFTGVLAEFDTGSVTLKTAEGEMKIERTKILKINRAINLEE